MKLINKTIFWAMFLLMLISCGNKPKVDMVLIPGTNYKMLRTEVTQKLYTEVIGENPSEFKGDNLPVESVNWYDAIEFCNKLSEICGLKKVYILTANEVILDSQANGFRLPTSGEWEYVAKGANKSKGYKYSGSGNIDEVAWYWKNSGIEYLSGSDFDWDSKKIGSNQCKTHDVATKAPNELGIYDMCGNVMEWCWDIKKDQNDKHCVKGGSFGTPAMCCEISYLFGVKDINRYYDLGFRIVRTIK